MLTMTQAAILADRIEHTRIPAIEASFKVSAIVRRDEGWGIRFASVPFRTEHEVYDQSEWERVCAQLLGRPLKKKSGTKID